jgi:hypothetical protein
MKAKGQHQDGVHGPDLEHALKTSLSKSNYHCLFLVQSFKNYRKNLAEAVYYHYSFSFLESIVVVD